ncbi:MAG: sulfotransferase family 2 domain-containing protein [Saprospiraceae bacterium]|nr:sulfotransferase family 2 domain-containing protein [Saprospiraceae bacterium]
MAILLKNDAVFLHVPKTGGTYLRRLFVALDLVRFNFSRDHADMERVINVSGHYPGNFLRCSMRLGKNLDRYTRHCYKFCFVRHPFDWYESYWRFRCDHPGERFVPPRQMRTRFGFKYDDWHPWALVEPLFDPDFNRFLENVIRHCPGYLTQLYSWYADPLHIDFVGKQETLIADTRHILDHLGIRYPDAIFQQQGRVNESRAARPQWDAANRDMIYRLEYVVFQQYGYSPQGSDPA